MSAARQLIALLKSHLEEDEEQFLSVAMQAAASEARRGHTRIAEEMRELIEEVKSRRSALERTPDAIPMLQPKGDLATLLSVSYSDLRLSSVVLPHELQDRLRRVVTEQRQQHRLREHGLVPRRKLLFLGPPGSGKTMTASALAGELQLPLFTILLEGVITRFLGETAAKLKVIFDAMVSTRGVYFFDEFDAIGARRTAPNDVGEIRRVLNSFLQFLERDQSQGLIVAATNHPALLDVALFRRFDDVVEYILPSTEIAEKIIKTRLSIFDASEVAWSTVLECADGLSQAELARASDEAAKIAVLQGRRSVETDDLLLALQERREASRSS